MCIQPVFEMNLVHSGWRNCFVSCAVVVGVQQCAGNVLYPLVHIRLALSMLNVLNGSELQWEFTKEFVRLWSDFTAKIFPALRPTRSCGGTKKPAECIALG